MRSFDALRLTGISLALLLSEMALQLARPEWRSGYDLFLVWLLILSASRGPLLAVSFALMGGFLMDSASGHFPLFHMAFYLVPVAIGTLFRSQLIVEYNLLGGLCTLGLLAGKILAMLLLAWAGGLLPGLSYAWQINYWPLLLASGLVLVGWRWLVGLAQAPRTVSVGR
jgi:hypothetical protein